MLLCRVWATVLIPTLAVASLFPSPPQQLTFNSPDTPSISFGRLLKLAWSDKQHLEAAVQAFEDHDIDIWSTRRSSTTQWETIIRWPQDSTDSTPLDSALYALEAAGIPRPDSTDSLASLSDHLSSSTLLPSYSRSLSASILANATPSSHTSVTDAIHDTYHPYEAIHTILVGLEKTFPNWVKVFSLGKSSEGRDIWAAKLTNLSSTPAEAEAEAAGTAAPSSANDEEEEEEEEEEEDEDDDIGPAPLFKKRHRHHRDRKLEFVVAGTQHAREWVAASTILYLIHDLLALQEEAGGKMDEKARARLLNQVDFTFVPVVNPDGYVYSWDVDRLWRKSRQHVGKDCFGIDLNRNWGFHFHPGTRPNPCSDSYPGATAFESAELQALSSYLASRTNRVDAFLDVHSFGQMLLYPYSYTCDLRTRDEENQAEAVLTMGKALKSVHGRAFETGSVCEVSLTSPGQSLDWAYASAKIRWSFAAELRDAGIFGFLLPPSQIRPSGEEMSAALRALTQFILDKEDGKR
ncbi:hypothetical protein JCM11641_005936 [Rhodosporidiobolus odoratus]